MCITFNTITGFLASAYVRKRCVNKTYTAGDNVANRQQFSNDAFVSFSYFCSHHEHQDDGGTELQNEENIFNLSQRFEEDFSKTASINNTVGTPKPNWYSTRKSWEQSR